MEAWITRNGSAYRGPFHALGRELPAQARPASRNAWRARYFALCGAHLERRVPAGDQRKVRFWDGRKAEWSERVVRPMAEWDPADRRACHRCRKVVKDRHAQEEREEARKYAAEADDLLDPDAPPPPWWHE